jgi:hypothetical protein
MLMVAVMKPLKERISSVVTEVVFVCIENEELPLSHLSIIEFSFILSLFASSLHVAQCTVATYKYMLRDVVFNDNSCWQC